MPTKPKPEQTVSKANRFDRGVRSNGIPKSSTSAIVVSQEVALLIQEVSTARDRIAKLEAQIATEQNGRRADVERLMRELMEAEKRAVRAEVQMELFAKQKTDTA